MNNVFYDLETGLFNTKPIAICILNGLIGYRVDDKQEIRELVHAITFSTVEQQLEIDLKEKIGSDFTSVGSYIDLSVLRVLEDVLVEAIDARSKRLMINIYRPESGHALEAIINQEICELINSLGDTSARDDKGSQQLRNALAQFADRENSQAVNKITS